MAVQQEIKSQLAKLLATEDLVVEHKNVSTAQFEVHTRVLTLPMWERASGVVYDMLVGHEVGHALYTPDEWDWRDEIPQQFMNVVEDVRIEKLMKRKYLGIAKTFFRGYNELHEKDFFEINDEDYNSFNLADRVNLFYKIGSFINVSFSDAEKEIVDLIGKCETFEEVKEAAKVLYEYCKKQQEEKISLENQPKKGEDKVELNSEGQTDEGKEGEEESQIDSPQTPQMEESGSDRGEVQDEPQEPEIRTADALDERLQSLVNEQGGENNYVELPKVNLDTIIASNKEVHKVMDEYFTQSEVDHAVRIARYTSLEESGIPSSPFTEVDGEFIKFKRSAQKEVSYLVKEFECKKAASAYARASTSRTGVLDTTKLHTYKFNEDIFKKVTVLPDGKNHGLVFILDWSGSMQYVLQDTLKQLYNLIWFCKKVQIPFEVYAFTNEWSREVRYSQDEKLPEHYEKKEGLLQIDNHFNLMNLLTSKTNSKTLEHQMINIWRLAECFGNRMQTWYRYPERMTLSGTPLNEAIVTLHQLLPQFQKDNKVEKTQCIILTDGEANYLPYHKLIEDSYFGTKDEPYLGSRNVRPGRTFLRDRKVGRTYGFQYEYHQFTDVLLNNLKDRFPTTNFIGIRVLPNREASRFIRLYNPCGNNKLSEDWKKTKSFTIKNSGYDAYFAMSANSLADDPEFEVQEDATKAQIKRAFVKSLKTKKLNKKVLGEFVSLVA